MADDMLKINRIKMKMLMNGSEIDTSETIHEIFLIISNSPVPTYDVKILHETIFTQQKQKWKSIK